MPPQGGSVQHGKTRGRPVSRVLFRGLRPLDDHSSGPAVTDGLKLPTRASGLKRPCGGIPDRGPGPARARPLFGIAPGGACRAVPVARSAVGSYPTVSPSPRTRRRAGGADSSLWRFPSGYPGRALPGTLASWSPDFPRQGLPPAAVIRPSAQAAVKGASRPRQPESGAQDRRRCPHPPCPAAPAPRAESASAMRPSSTSSGASG
jgi:hypothetical protein